jgi:hypothetical protein
MQPGYLFVHRILLGAAGMLVVVQRFRHVFQQAIARRVNRQRPKALLMQKAVRRWRCPWAWGAVLGIRQGLP